MVTFSQSTSMKRTAASQTAHDDLVRMMTQHFKSLGYTDIKADIPGSPARHHQRHHADHRPDLTCRKNDYRGSLIILEAETATPSTFPTQQVSGLSCSAASRCSGEFHWWCQKPVALNPAALEHNAVSPNFVSAPTKSGRLNEQPLYHYPTKEVIKNVQEVSPHRSS